MCIVGIALLRKKFNVKQLCENAAFSGCFALFGVDWHEKLVFSFLFLRNLARGIDNKRISENSCFVIKAV